MESAVGMMDGPCCMLLLVELWSVRVAFASWDEEGPDLPTGLILLISDHI